MSDHDHPPGDPRWYSSNVLLIATVVSGCAFFAGVTLATDNQDSPAGRSLLFASLALTCAEIVYVAVAGAVTWVRTQFWIHRPRTATSQNQPQPR